MKNLCFQLGACLKPVWAVALMAATLALTVRLAPGQAAHSDLWQ